MTTTLQKAEELLASLSNDEKAALLDRITMDLTDSFPGVESDPNVCGGDARIVRTRIPVWILEQARRLGVCDSELLLSYPTLRSADLANAWSYARTHQEEMDLAIRENEEA